MHKFFFVQKLFQILYWNSGLFDAYRKAGNEDFLIISLAFMTSDLPIDRRFYKQIIWRVKYNCLLLFIDIVSVFHFNCVFRDHSGVQFDGK